MATLAETIWVHNQSELERTVSRLVAQGGVVQDRSGDEVHVYLKKKLNVVVLVVGLILCLVPGLAYLIWYSAADQSQAITVKIGDAPNIGGYHPDEGAGAGRGPAATTGASATSAAPTAPLPGPSGEPAGPVPPAPTAVPGPAAEPAHPVSEASPMPPATGETPPPAPSPPSPSS